jgi:ABC-type sugar transport system substrate-binding protein
MIVKTRHRVIMTFWVMLMGMFFCYAGTAGAETFKIGTLSPEGSVWMEAMREGADLVAEKTKTGFGSNSIPVGSWEVTRRF